MMYANRGMYAEEIVNRTIDYYLTKNICLLEKRNIPIKIVKNINDNLIVGKLLSKSTVDYCGYVNNKHVEFEVKQTSNENFNMVMLKDYQYEYLKNSMNHGACSFVIVNFAIKDEFYLIPFKWLDEYLINNKTKCVKYIDIKNECYQLEIIYPGILDLKEKLTMINMMF